MSADSDTIRDLFTIATTAEPVLIVILLTAPSSEKDRARPSKKREKYNSVMLICIICIALSDKVGLCFSLVRLNPSEALAALGLQILVRLDSQDSCLLLDYSAHSSVQALKLF